MYGDTHYGHHDSRPLSYVASPHNDTLNALSASPTSPTALAHTSSNERYPPPRNGLAKMSAPPGQENGAGGQMPGYRESSPIETANAHFPLNDVDYESSPAAVAQEMVNLQALRRMSMVDNAAADPDLPSYKTSIMPTVAPTGADDEEDASRLFWVPARIHPELAPKEFKSFLETRVDQIKRRSGDEDMLLGDGPRRNNSLSSLRRKKSMLSRQIDNSAGAGAEGYRDGAERLEKKRSLTHPHNELTVADLQNLDTAQDTSELVTRLSLEMGSPMLENGEGPEGEDMPILPAAPPGNSLRRSTRTTYRRGSLRKGERVLPSKRAVRPTDPDSEEGQSPVTSPVNDSGFTSLPLARTSSEQLPGGDEQPENFSRPSRLGRRTTAGGSGSGSVSSAQSDDGSMGRASSEQPGAGQGPSAATFAQRAAAERALSANSRPGAIPATMQEPPIPTIVETPPLVEDDGAQPASPYAPPVHIPERVSSHEPPPTMAPQAPLPSGPPKGIRPMSKGGLIRQAQNANPRTTLNDIVGQPSPLPGNSTRTDSLSFIPTFSDEKKSDKKSKDKKDKDGHDGPKKSSWGWLLGNEEKEKEKEGTKKGKSKGGKVNDNTRLDLLQTSIDGGRGRESLVLDRESVKLDEERRKESSRKSSGGEKREKESGIFSSFFGGGKRKSDRESSGKKDRSSRGLSPDPPQRVLKPDVDYNWTRFSILEERAIYRMAHMKLANPRRALYSQVLLSNFMYSYLAKVQQMHPQMQIPQSAAQKQRQQQQPQASRDSDQDAPIPDLPYYDYPEVGGTAVEWGRN
ncbi:MAG: hypothetical protein M1838_001692 [Thelocarpon superellum]|nr:MAG: hypothetical protein M1838_001692 [Thelocarpon superellum]